MVIIFVKMTARPEKRRELSQTLLSIVEKVRNEIACLKAGFYQNIESEDDFLVVEEWATQTDLDDHMKSDLFTVLLGTGTLMQRPPEMVIHEVSHPTSLET